MKTNWPKFDPILPDNLNVMTYIVFSDQARSHVATKRLAHFFRKRKVKIPLRSPVQ